MTTTPPTLNGIRALSVTLLTPWKGPWSADVDLDPDVIATAPTSGLASLVVGGQTLVGTIDPRASGSFVASGRARVVGGAGGWDKVVTPQNWQNDGGITSTLVYSATASLVGERVSDLAPTVFTSFVRDGGEASGVFRDTDWWVDFTGLTNVGARAPATPDATLEILEWDATEQRATVACDALVVPGTVLSDKRLNGATPIVRTVEQTFSKGGGARATLWCAAQPVDPLAAALAGLVRRFAGTAFLRDYRYRIVLQGADGRLQLQAVFPAAGQPDMLPISIWPGMQGVTARVLLGGEAIVRFFDGDPAQPYVSGFRLGDVPTVLGLDASVEVDLGASASIIKLAGGGAFLVPAPFAAALVDALRAFTVGLAPSTVAANGAALALALNALPPSSTLITKAT